MHCKNTDFGFIRRILPKLCFACMAIILASCMQKQPIKIGYVASLRGIMSELGVSGRNGAQMAVDTVNAQGGVLGRQLKLVVLDDGNDAETAKQQVQSLKDEGISLIIGPLTSAAAAGMADYFKNPDMLILSPTVTMASAYGLPDSLILFLPPNNSQGIKLAEIALRRGKSAAVFIEETNSAYTSGVFSGFSKAFTEGGGTVSFIQRYHSSTSITIDKELCASALATKPDLLVSIGPAPETATLVQFSQEILPGIPVLSSTWSMTNDLIQLAGAHTKELRVLGFVDPTSPNPSYKEFKQIYESRFGGVPSFSSTLSHDAVTTLVQAIKKARSLKPSRVRGAILDATFGGLQYSLIFDEFGDPSQPIQVFKIVEGNFTSAGE